MCLYETIAVPWLVAWACGEKILLCCGNLSMGRPNNNGPFTKVIGCGEDRGALLSPSHGSKTVLFGQARTASIRRDGSSTYGHAAGRVFGQ